MPSLLRRCHVHPRRFCGRLQTIGHRRIGRIEILNPENQRLPCAAKINLLICLLNLIHFTHLEQIRSAEVLLNLPARQRLRPARLSSAIAAPTPFAAVSAAPQQSCTLPSNQGSPPPPRSPLPGARCVRILPHKRLSHDQRQWAESALQLSPANAQQLQLQ